MTALLQSDLALVRLPTEDDLPDTDHQPVDKELQLLVPLFVASDFVASLGQSLGLVYGCQSGGLSGAAPTGHWP